MIKRETFTSEHINKIKGNTRVDPSLLERSIFAMGLLEALARTELPFVFKGGTSLMLLLDSPRRLSVDIDIVVPSDVDVDKYVSEACTIFPFVRAEEQVRKSGNKIVKKHYKFYYDSHVSSGEFYILLDILFEDNLYAEVVNKRIQTEFLITEEPYIEVTVPTGECLLGDKLTAFAPHTTGIPFDIGKEVEIIKQFYDIGNLIEIFSDINLVKSTYEAIAKAEMRYRGDSYPISMALEDALDTAVCIASQGMINPEEFIKLKEGIRGITTYIYGENFSVERAISTACQIMYLAACLLKGTEFSRITNASTYAEEKINSKKYSKLSYLKKTDLTAFGYVVEATKLLEE